MPDFDRFCIDRRDEVNWITQPKCMVAKRYRKQLTGSCGGRAVICDAGRVLHVPDGLYDHNRSHLTLWCDIEQAQRRTTFRLFAQIAK
jgi:hypothetical protein